MTGEACRELLAIVEPIFARYKFELLINFTTVNQRALCGVINICFDKSDDAECHRALECYDELFDLLVQRGFIPYRVGRHNMASVHGINERIAVSDYIGMINFYVQLLRSTEA